MFFETILSLAVVSVSASVIFEDCGKFFMSLVNIDNESRRETILMVSVFPERYHLDI